MTYVENASIGASEFAMGGGAGVRDAQGREEGERN